MPDPVSLTLQWPAMLWLLAALPVLAAFQLWQSRRGNRATLRYAGLGEIVPQRGAAARLRRYTPPVLMLLGIAALIIAVARPQAALMLPARLESIILAIDVSGSMKATDIAPDRITAARAAAKAFLDEQPRKVRIGVVSIAATAAVAQSPTTNRDDILQVMEQFQLQRGSAIGSGILIAMETLLPEAGMNREDHFRLSPIPARRDLPRGRRA